MGPVLILRLRTGSAFTSIHHPPEHRLTSPTLEAISYKWTCGESNPGPARNDMSNLRVYSHDSDTLLFAHGTGVGRLSLTRQPVSHRLYS